MGLSSEPSLPSIFNGVVRVTEERQFLRVRVPQQIHVRVKEQLEMRGRESASEADFMHEAVDAVDVVGTEGEEGALDSQGEEGDQNDVDGNEEQEEFSAHINYQERAMEAGEAESDARAIAESTELANILVRRLTRFKVEQCIGNLQRLLLTAEVDDDMDHETKCCIEELEQATYRLWRTLEAAGREKDRLAGLSRSQWAIDGAHHG